MLPKPLKVSTAEKNKAKADELRRLNRLVWERDSGQCVVCGSGRIFGVRGQTGAHHILSRNAHPAQRLDVKNLVLLCHQCHENANTEAMVRKLFATLAERHKYDYSDLPYRYYKEKNEN